VRRAIISDIHGNLEALEAVLVDIEAQRVNEIFCLGDIVGYGPNPCECIDRVIKTCRVTLLGNHDQAALSERARSKWPSRLNHPGDQLDDRKAIINVGSVGQPRDRDSRACYMILDDGPNVDVNAGEGEDQMPGSSRRIAYRRVPYDFDTTIRKINEIMPP
jgi:predicted phosphodiesterase